MDTLAPIREADRQPLPLSRLRRWIVPASWSGDDLPTNGEFPFAVMSRGTYVFLDWSGLRKYIQDNLRGRRIFEHGKWRTRTQRLDYADSRGMNPRDDETPEQFRERLAARAQERREERLRHKRHEVAEFDWSGEVSFNPDSLSDAERASLSPVPYELVEVTQRKDSNFIYGNTLLGSQANRPEIHGRLHITAEYRGREAHAAAPELNAPLPLCNKWHGQTHEQNRPVENAGERDKLNDADETLFPRPIGDVSTLYDGRVNDDDESSADDYAGTLRNEEHAELYEGTLKGGFQSGKKPDAAPWWFHRRYEFLIRLKRETAVQAIDILERYYLRGEADADIADALDFGYTYILGKKRGHRKITEKYIHDERHRLLLAGERHFKDSKPKPEPPVYSRWGTRPPKIFMQMEVVPPDAGMRYRVISRRRVPYRKLLLRSRHRWSWPGREDELRELVAV